MSGSLFVVATPIGNLGDITARAVETLREVSRVAAEDTRRTRALLSHLGIAGKPVDSLHAHSEARDVERIVAHLLEGESVALVTDAGTPAVSDPGSALVRGAIEAGVRVVPIPGPSAVLAALVGSGLAGDVGFRFMGFLPRAGPPRHAAIARAAETPEPVVLFEAPSRTGETLLDLAAITPERRACVARELTKMHEEMVRGTLQELAAMDREWIGEIALVLAAHDPDARADTVDEAAIDGRIDSELARGVHAKVAAEKIAAWSGRPKREIYARVLQRKRKTETGNDGEYG